MTRHRIGWAVAVLVVLAAPAHAQHAGEYAQADIEFGAQVYNGTCVRCHGPNGDEVPNVDLRTGQFRRATSDFMLRRIISAGIPDTPMPPGNYTEAELTGLVAFVRTMGDIDPSTLSIGDADRGRALYEGKGDCASCHRVKGKGSRTGPDLTRIGAMRSAAALEGALVDPTGSMLPINRPIRAVTRDGREITGRRLNEDTFSVQIIDHDERLVSLKKADLREYEVVTESPMPAYGDLMSEQELSDLLAYLLSLKGV